ICFIAEGLVVIWVKFQLKWSFEYGHRLSIPHKNRKPRKKLKKADFEVTIFVAERQGISGCYKILRIKLVWHLYESQ
ncbi:MAG: hypothetical protein ACM3Q2_14075, partial [Syntrophothermus sp.]